MTRYDPWGTTGAIGWGTTTSTTSTASVWYNTATMTTSGTQITATWESWNTSGTGEWYVARRPQAIRYEYPRPEFEEFTTHAERLAEALRLEELTAEAERLAKAREERQEADKKAVELLEAHLTDEQKASYRKERYFEVISKESRRRYRIYHGRSQNIVQVDENGRKIKRLCAHPVMAVPDADTVLAQKLMLEHAEDQFLRIANVS